MFRKFLKQGPVSVALSVILSMFFVAAAVQAATTISTNITTAGTLSVTGLSTLLGGATTTSITLLSGDMITNTSASSTSLSGDLTIGVSGPGTRANSLTVTNAADATSTVTVGCVVTTATSSATKIKMIFNTVSTSTDVGHTVNGNTVNGYVLWAYGTTCS